MKKTLLTVLAIVALAAFAQAEIKIGIINPPKILQVSLKGKEVLGRLNQLQETIQKKYESMQREIDSLQKEVLSPVLNEETREKKNLELQNKKTELNRYAEDERKNLGLKQQKEYENMQRELMPIIEKIARDNGYSLVLDVTTAGVAFVDPALDITDSVIKAFDAKQAAPAKPK